MQFFLVQWNCLLPDPDVQPNVLRDCVQLHESEKGGQVEKDGQVEQDGQVKKVDKLSKINKLKKMDKLNKMAQDGQVS